MFFLFIKFSQEAKPCQFGLLTWFKIVIIRGKKGIGFKFKSLCQQKKLIIVIAITTEK